MDISIKFNLGDTVYYKVDGLIHIGIVLSIKVVHNLTEAWHDKNVNSRFGRSCIVYATKDGEYLEDSIHTDVNNLIEK